MARTIPTMGRCRERCSKGGGGWVVLGRAAAFVVPLLASGCATTGSTVGSGVGDRLVDRPPYSGGAVPMPLGRVAHLPIAYQRGSTQSSIFDPEGGVDTPVDALLREMNAYLDSLGASVRVGSDRPFPGVAPDVQFGCEPDTLDGCAPESRNPSSRRGPWMRLAVARPSPGWIAAADRALQESGADRLLVLTLEVGQYWPHQRNWRGDKEVRLGRGHSVEVPWLTALDQPVQVLQLTGALMGQDGRAAKIAAEGLVAQRTSVVLSGLGVQALISDGDVARIRTARREDLPGRPLVWQVALRSLVAELTGQLELRIH